MIMKISLNKIRQRFTRRTWITLIIVMGALLLELISAAQYNYAKRILEDELEKKASIEITMKAILVKSMLNSDEVKSQFAEAQDFTVKVNGDMLEMNDGEETLSLARFSTIQN